MISAAVLAALIRTCSPALDVRTESAIVAVESQGDSWAIHDPIRNRAVHPHSYAEAVKVANALIAEDAQHRGRGVAVGLAQVLLPRPGLSAAAMLHPCSNLRASQAILVAAYSRQYRAVRAGSELEREQIALRRAFSQYNSGSPTAAPEYVDRIMRALSSPLVEQTTAIADGLGPSAPPSFALPASAFARNSTATPAPTATPYVSSMFYAERAQ
ncbi:MAG: hypothetical protein ACREM8_02820 [Vulcanimicrobiaceae bacterium]